MAAIDLTTLAKVKSELGDVQTTNVDPLLGTLITSASRWLMNQCGRRFKEDTVTWVTDGDSTLGITLPNGPVTDVEQVSVDGMAIPEITTVGDGGWIQRGDRIELVNYRFTTGVGNVQVVYTSGYAVVPEDLEQACIEMTCWMYRNRDHFGLQQKSTHDSTAVTYRKDEPPYLVQCVVANYQSHFGMALEGG